VEFVSLKHKNLRNETMSTKFFGLLWRHINSKTPNTLLTTTALALGGSYLFSHKVAQADEALHPAQYPWKHKGYLDSLDHASIRRGFQVYREICATCHSMNRITYGNLVDVAYTQEEMKAIAAEDQIVDEFDDNGEPKPRTRKLFDPLPAPYQNEQQARAANNRALPPDLSLMKKARHGGEDYIFALLTGYREPPAGITMKGGLHYNPYFPGGAIAMAQALYDGVVKYEDGTPATQSQMAKDVTTYLAWAAEPEHDERKRLGIKVVLITGTILVFAYYSKKFTFSVLKNRKFVVPRS